MAPYILDSNRADGRQDLLAQALDPFSRARINDLLFSAQNAVCWEVGAGNGSVAKWLAGKVGPSGMVLATDLDVSRIPDLPRLERQVHDVDLDPPLSPRHRARTGWDLIHARLVLAHLGNRELVLGQLARELNPGGVLLIEDWYTANADTILAAPTPEAAALYREFQETLSERVFGWSGVDRAWARNIHSTMLDAGLENVHTVIHSESWTAGDLSCRQHALTAMQLRDRLLGAGMTAGQLSQVHDLLTTPGSGLVVRGHLLYSTSGQRPGGVR